MWITLLEANLFVSSRNSDSYTSGDCGERICPPRIRTLENESAPKRQFFARKSSFVSVIQKGDDPYNRAVFVFNRRKSNLFVAMCVGQMIEVARTLVKQRRLGMFLKQLFPRGLLLFHSSFGR